jgi:hypothetical protein
VSKRRGARRSRRSASAFFNARTAAEGPPMPTRIVIAGSRGVPRYGDEAIQEPCAALDCFVASLLAMTPSRVGNGSD